MVKYSMVKVEYFINKFAYAKINYYPITKNFSSHFTSVPPFWDVI